MKENTNFVIIPSDLNNIKEIIAKPINAILIGLANFSFGIVSIDFSNLKNIIDLCKKNNVKLFLNINKLFSSEEINALEKLLLELENIAINGVFFEDLAILNISKRNGLKMPLIWNQNHLVTNYDTINYYALEGVKGANLATEITLEEINEIKNNTEINLYVKVFGWTHMMNTPRNLISNYLEYIGEVKETGNYFLYEEERKQYYLIKEEADGTLIYNYEILNALSLLNELKDNYYLIIDGTNIDSIIFNKIVDIYLSVNNLKNMEEVNDLNNQIIKLIDRPLGLGFFNKKTIFKVKNL